MATKSYDRDLLKYKINWEGGVLAALDYGLRPEDIEDERLRGVVLPDERQVWNFSPNLGHCRVAPERAVLLVLTDKGGCEIVFGFAWYPAALCDIHGKELMRVPEAGKWFFRDFVDSGDPRYRQIVKRFADAGYVEAERDEFKAA